MILETNKEIIKDFFSNVGCNKNNLIVGPCSIESEEQIEYCAQQIKKKGYKYIRGGAYKPRTSSNSFQGLGIKGLKYLKKSCDKHSLISVSEIMSLKQLQEGYEYVDIIQIGSRNMQNFELLKELALVDKPVILKRGFMSTIEEFCGAASYLTSKGKNNVILCERGIRSFDSETRNVLDIMAVPLMKEKTNLPIIIDVSHSTGRRDLLLPASEVAKGIKSDGIMIEVHPNPSKALSDAKQQINFEEFEKLSTELWEENYEYRKTMVKLY